MSRILACAAVLLTVVVAQGCGESSPASVRDVEEAFADAGEPLAIQVDYQGDSENPLLAVLVPQGDLASESSLYQVAIFRSNALAANHAESWRQLKQLHEIRGDAESRLHRNILVVVSHEARDRLDRINSALGTL